jgi:radical SAM-linked protein
VSSIRVRFSRGESVKFISHLDLMKVFERAIRRSGLPIAYSKGFNPHPQMVFGLPLSVGMTSDCEYADFELADETEPEKFMKRLNASLPAGIRVTAAAVNNSKRNIMASISGAEYLLQLFTNDDLPFDKASAGLESMLKCVSVKAEKESMGKDGRKALKETEIRPMIINAEIEPIEAPPPGYEGFGSAYRIKAVLKAGSEANLRPDLFLKAFVRQLGVSADAVRIHRSALYSGSGGKMADPLDKVCLS